MDAETRQWREFTSVLWMIGVAGFIWFVGFIQGLPPVIFLYVYYHERDLVRALTATVIVTAFIFVLFVEVLNSPLWEGMISVELPL